MLAIHGFGLHFERSSLKDLPALLKALASVESTEIPLIPPIIQAGPPKLMSWQLPQGDPESIMVLAS